MVTPFTIIECMIMIKGANQSVGDGEWAVAK